eukprot:CAMPEP_0202711614 /NCGR_PEP_ID=MMETSP1385-20130828/23362_1 /ASSEMBLY_ACC=CAM_ASM_000861 /TAXON_ID=933848 /ORGANISM="Elphidium margaritaceum" /LENGTH=500 /DNA_ID=CAMNT_0049371373 /DNA_START=25 /DNA_END=1527 /DNA_ORIENTATION=-
MMIMAADTIDTSWACPQCTFKNHIGNKACEMCQYPKPGVNTLDQDQPPSESATLKFKKLIQNAASTSKLFNTAAATATASTSTSNGTHGGATATKSVQELEEEIEILHLQKEDLRKLVSERTQELDSLKKLDHEHQNVRQRWQEHEEKVGNELSNVRSYTEELKREVEELKTQNRHLQSKSTSHDVLKNKLENKVREQLESEDKLKKLLDKKTQEKKVLVAEVLKLRGEKQNMVQQHSTEMDAIRHESEAQLCAMRVRHERALIAAQSQFNELHLIYKNYKHNIVHKIANIDSTSNAFEAMIQNANIGSLSQTECNKILENIIQSIERMEAENQSYHDILQKRQATVTSGRKCHDDEVDDDEHEQTTTIEPQQQQEQNGEEEEEAESKTLDVVIDDIEAVQLSTETPGGSVYDYHIDMDEDMLLNEIESRVLKTLREKALLQRSSNELMGQLQSLQSEHEQRIREKDETIMKHEIRAKVSFFGKKGKARKNSNKQVKESK